MKILYVEDNKINAIVMNKMLSKNNLPDMIVAETPEKALKIVKDTHVDLILLDINLGPNQMDGCELLQRMRRIELLRTKPIYAVTAYAMPGDKKRFINIGFDKYFPKPVNFKKLLSVISSMRSNIYP